MKLITERSCILDASNRWDAQYPPHSCQNDKKKIGDVLRATDLGKCTADDLEKITGNRSWSTPETCSECGAEGVATIQLGQEPDYESRTAWICERCLNKAIDMFKKARKQK